MQTLLEAWSPQQDTTTERVLVVDGGSAFAQALVCLLDRGGVAASHATFGQAPDACDALRPSVLLLGADADADVLARCVGAARRQSPDVRILLLGRDGPGGQDDATIVEQIGAVGRVTAHTDPERLLELVREGNVDVEIVLEPALAVVRPLRRDQSTERLLIDQLTSRELEILRELMAGQRGATIARRLGISHNTVRTHVQNILAKLGAHTRLQAATIGLRAGVSPASQEGVADRGIQG